MYTPPINKAQDWDLAPPDYTYPCPELGDLGEVSCLSQQKRNNACDFSFLILLINGKLCGRHFSTERKGSAEEATLLISGHHRSKEVVDKGSEPNGNRQ